jgi:hypothetical protein
MLAAIFFFELACLAESQPTTVARMSKIFTVAGALLLVLALGIVASTPEQEKAFTDKYKAAFEGKDTANAGVLPLHTRLRPGGSRVLQNDAVGRSRTENFLD